METSPGEQLLFVSNANPFKGSIFPRWLLSLWGRPIPGCRFREIGCRRATWKNFEKQLDAPITVLSKAAFTKTYRSKFAPRFTFPIVLVTGDLGFEVLVGAKELASIRTPKVLWQLVRQRLREER
ncbi:MAG: hypothetical protein AAGF77_04640 [Bacteroidota bacterium]